MVASHIPAPPPKGRLPEQIDAERIAASIRTAAEMGKRLRSCGLTQRAVALLVADASGVNITDVKYVLAGLENLGKFLA